jgi:hypothetical protein
LVVLDDAEVVEDLVGEMVEVLTWLCAGLCGRCWARNRALKVVRLCAARHPPTGGCGRQSCRWCRSGWSVMSTQTQQSQSQAEQRQWRTHAKADRRRRDGGLVACVVAERVGIAVADRARAMGAAGVYRQLTEAQATDVVVAVDGPLLEVTYSLKSGQWRSAWFDLMAIEPGAGQS